MSDPKEQFFKAYKAQLAKEEAAWRRANPGKVRFYLVGASDEPATFTREGQAALRSVVSDLRDNHIEADAPFMAVDAADAVSGYTGEIATLASAFGPILTGILGAWLQSRTGRKVRLKDGDLDVEAQSVEQLKEILDAHAKLRKDRDAAP